MNNKNVLRRKGQQHQPWIKISVLAIPVLLIIGLVSTLKSMTSFGNDNDLVGNLRSNKKAKRKLEFVHITKTGGSAIEKLGADHDIIWGACHYMNITEVGCFNPDIPYTAPNFQSYALTSPWHTPPKILRSRVKPTHDPLKDADLFTIVRNPYSRVVSEYYCPWTGYRKENGMNDPDVMNKWITNTVLKLEEFLLEFKSNANDSLTPPKEQARGLNEDPQLLAQKHFVSQAEYVYDDDGKQIVKNIIYYENIREEFNNLMRQYGMDNVQLGERKSHTVNARNDESKLSYLDLYPETIAIINRFSAKDFELLGYEMVDKFDKDGTYSLSPSKR